MAAHTSRTFAEERRSAIMDMLERGASVQLRLWQNEREDNFFYFLKGKYKKIESAQFAHDSRGAPMAAHTSRTFADERRAAILEMLERGASVQVSDIAETFGVSSVTARADLDALASAGKLRRTHGGAVSLHKKLTVSVQDQRINVNVNAKRADLDALASAGKLRRTHGGAVSLHKKLTVSVQDQRINVNVNAKQAIAGAAIELVRDGDTVFVDSGTTALEFVRMLNVRSDVTVITADITIADFIDESLPGVSVIMLGGELRQGHRYLYGPLTMASLGALHADLAVICPGAFVSSRGFMTDFPQMAEIKTAAMGMASRRHLPRGVRLEPRVHDRLPPDGGDQDRGHGDGLAQHRAHGRQQARGPRVHDRLPPDGGDQDRGHGDGLAQHRAHGRQQARGARNLLLRPALRRGRHRHR